MTNTKPQSERASYSNKLAKGVKYALLGAFLTGAVAYSGALVYCNRKISFPGREQFVEEVTRTGKRPLTVFYLPLIGPVGIGRDNTNDHSIKLRTPKLGALEN